MSVHPTETFLLVLFSPVYCSMHLVRRSHVSTKSVPFKTLPEIGSKHMKRICLFIQRPVFHMTSWSDLLLLKALLKKVLSLFNIRPGATVLNFIYEIQRTLINYICKKRPSTLKCHQEFLRINFLSIILYFRFWLFLFFSPNLI